MTDKLNPLLFSKDNKLDPMISEKIKVIVNLFIEYTDIDVKILDIRLVGSNAAYNYNAQSDLDIHIIVDLSKVADPETIARLYFDSVKKNFKDSYDIKIKGIEVEIYIEDVNTTSVSNGIYSISQDKWIKEPKESIYPTDEQLADANSIAKDILSQLTSTTSPEDLEDVIDQLYMMRKDGLASEGENSPKNLAFKILRNKGILDQVKSTHRDIISQELSVESKHVVGSEQLYEKEANEPEDSIVHHSPEGHVASYKDDTYNLIEKSIDTNNSGRDS